MGHGPLDPQILIRVVQSRCLRRRALNAFKFDPDAWRRFIHFSSSKYTRNLVVYEKQFSVLLLCWARFAAVH